MQDPALGGGLGIPPGCGKGVWDQPWVWYWQWVGGHSPTPYAGLGCVGLFLGWVPPPPFFFSPVQPNNKMAAKFISAPRWELPSLLALPGHPSTTNVREHPGRRRDRLFPFSFRALYVFDRAFCCFPHPPFSASPLPACMPWGTPTSTPLDAQCRRASPGIWGSRAPPASCILMDEGGGFPPLRGSPQILPAAPPSPVHPHGLEVLAPLPLLIPMDGILSPKP